MTIEEGNILIAEFMGYEIKPSQPHNGKTFLIRYKNNKHCGQWNQNGADKYHKSWDWLMPVVEKIESLWYRFELKQVRHEDEGNYYWVIFKSSATGERVIDYIGLGNIQTTYKGVIQFIEWYNKENN